MLKHLKICVRQHCVHVCVRECVCVVALETHSFGREDAHCSSVLSHRHAHLSQQRLPNVSSKLLSLVCRPLKPVTQLQYIFAKHNWDGTGRFGSH